MAAVTLPTHYRNVFAELGYAQAEIDARIENVGITKERSDGSYEQNKIFSISWTNGLSAAVPCLQAAHRLGDKTIRAAACPTRPGTPKTAGAVGAGGSTACTRAGIPAIWSDRRFIIS